MRKKSFLFGVVLVLSMMTFGGCGNNTNNSATDISQESPATTDTLLRDDDTDKSQVSPGTDNSLGDDLEQGTQDAVDGAEDAVDDVIDGTEDAVDDAADALDGED